MKKHVKQAVLIGLGLASLAAKEAKKITGKLVKDNKLNKKEAKILTKKLMQEGLKKEKIIRKRLELESKRFLNELENVSKKEVNKIHKKIKKKK